MFLPVTSLCRLTSGFDCVETAVRESVELLEHHPLIPKKISIYGFVIDTDTGLLKQVAGKEIE